MELNHQQKTAAEYDDGHVLVLAGAGSGKTWTITARIAHLLRNGTEPGRILLLTFTRRAAREMAERLRQMTGASADHIVSGTFHHYCLMTMRRMPAEFGVHGATVIDRDDQEQLIKLARAEVIEKNDKRPEPFPKARKLIELYSYARNTNRKRVEYLEKFTEHDEKTISEILRVFEDYDSRKKESNYLDFDDILFRFAWKLNRGDPLIRERIKKRFDHILVDEMQDTNPLQWLILDALRDPARLFCVGDDAQSIYAFRGADFRNVHSFTERCPDSTVLPLQKNYRSTQEILDLSNWLLDDSPLQYDKKLVAHRGNGKKPRLIEFHDDLEEAAWITGNLARQYQNGAPWRDHMIITRTGYSSRALETSLISRRIPYVFIGGISFLQSAHVKDLLCLVRCATNHRDLIAWMRYLTLWPGIGDVTAGRIINRMQDCPDLPSALEKLSGEPRLKDDIRSEVTQAPALVLARREIPAEAVKAAAGMLEPLLKMKYDRWDKRKRDFDLLGRLAAKHRTISGFLETYTLDPVNTTQVERSGEEDRVTLITAHSAKGTEAPTCYLIRVEPGMYPHTRSIGDEESEEEERRVLYVAMTRARDELIITRTLSQAGYNTFYGMSNGAGTPYFLEDVPDHLVEKELCSVHGEENETESIIQRR